MKKILFLVVAVLLCLPSTGRQTLNPGPAPTGKHKTDRSTLHRNSRAHLNNNAAHQQKTALVLMQQLDQVNYQEFDPETEEWFDYSKTAYTYDASGRNLTCTESYYNPGSGTYIPEDKWTYSYAGSQVAEMLISSWNSGTSQWENAFRYNYTYNPDGTLSTVLEYMWTAGIWLPFSKTINTWNDSGKLITSLYYYWNAETSEWMVSGKTENSYNANGSIWVSTDFMWDEGLSGWIGTTREEYTYNAGERPSIVNYFTWEISGSEWVNDYRDEYTYDAVQNVSMITGTMWMGNSWVPEYKNEFTYNNAYSFNDLILPNDFEGETLIFNHMVTQVIEFEYDGTTFAEIDRSLAEYSEVDITGIPDIAAGTGRIFPQPASGTFTFVWDSPLPFLDLTVYELSGKKVMAQKVGNNVPVLAGQLASGLYFYRLSGNNHIEYTGKLSIR